MNKLTPELIEQITQELSALEAHVVSDWSKRAPNLKQLLHEVVTKAAETDKLWGIPLFNIRFKSGSYDEINGFSYHESLEYNQIKGYCLSNGTITTDFGIGLIKKTLLTHPNDIFAELVTATEKELGLTLLEMQSKALLELTMFENHPINDKWYKSKWHSSYPHLYTIVNKIVAPLAANAGIQTLFIGLTFKGIMRYDIAIKEMNNGSPCIIFGSEFIRKTLFQSSAVITATSYRDCQWLVAHEIGLIYDKNKFTKIMILFFLLIALGIAALGCLIFIAKEPLLITASLLTFLSSLIGLISLCRYTVYVADEASMLLLKANFTTDDIESTVKNVLTSIRKNTLLSATESLPSTNFLRAAYRKCKQPIRLAYVFCYIFLYLKLVQPSLKKRILRLKKHLQEIKLSPPKL